MSVDLLYVLLVSAGLRMGQAAIEASPTLLCGLFVAGVFRRMLGVERIRRLFGDNSWRSLPLAWALGMALPVCSLGVFPVLRELRRSGITAGTILAFALAAPLFNPLSFLYGLSLSQPMVIFTFAFVSLVLLTAVGSIFDRLFRETPQVESEPVPAYWGGKRLLAVVLDSGYAVTGGAMLYVVIGLIGVGLLAMALPPGVLQHSMAHSDPTAPLLMTAVALPAYDSPIKAMMQLGLIFDHGNSVAAALTLLILGAGANLGTMAWTIREYNWKHGITWLGLVLLILLPAAYATEQPLYAATHEEDHTHAFDDFCRPFYPGQAGVAAELALNQLGAAVDLHEKVSLWAIGALVALGGVLRLTTSEAALNRWLYAAPPTVVEANVSAWNRPIPSSVLAGVMLVGLVFVSILGCYVYYPEEREAFEELKMVKIAALSAVLSGDDEQAERSIREFDDLSRRLEVGVMLRTWRLDRELQQNMEQLRHELEEIHDGLPFKDRDEARRRVVAVEQLYQATRTEALANDTAVSGTTLQP